MQRVNVDSSNLHSVGHDETGLEVQFHAKGCSRASARVPHNPCDCEGTGDVWHYAGVPPEVHSMILASPSPGAIFHSHVKAAKDAQGGLRYPAVKR